MGGNDPRVIALTLALRALRAVYGPPAEVIAGVRLRLSENSEPEPDVMVVASDLRRRTRKEDVLLVVEVADTSLRTDQTVKAALYASHGIPEYLLPDPETPLRSSPGG